jgi:hypothetical protein
MKVGDLVRFRDKLLHKDAAFAGAIGLVIETGSFPGTDKKKVRVSWAYLDPRAINATTNQLSDQLELVHES